LINLFGQFGLQLCSRIRVRAPTWHALAAMKPALMEAALPLQFVTEGSEQRVLIDATGKPD